MINKNTGLQNYTLTTQIVQNNTLTAQMVPNNTYVAKPHSNLLSDNTKNDIV